MTDRTTAGMVHLQGGIFRMGSEQFHPEWAAASSLPSGCGSCARNWSALPTGRVSSGRRAEIKAMLDAIPHLRPALRATEPEKRAESFEASNVNVAYDKTQPNAHTCRHDRTPTRAATTAPKPPQNDESRLARGGFRIAGAGSGHHPATGYRFVAVRELA